MGILSDDSGNVIQLIKEAYAVRTSGLGCNEDEIPSGGQEKGLGVFVIFLQSIAGIKTLFYLQWILIKKILGKFTQFDLMKNKKKTKHLTPWGH